ncbi:preprotein translocase subunit SecG [Patescibacteria group bacterium]
MKNILLIIQVVSAVVLIVFILMQSRGAGLGGIFGGSSNAYTTKRGMEKLLFVGTIITAMFFLGAALANVLLF